MPLQRVYQENDVGCFVAGLAILLGKTYAEAFKLVHPRKSYLDWCHGIEAVSMQEAALSTLQRLGVKAHVSRLRRFDSLRKSKKNMILIIRWEVQPTRCHTVVYDAESRKILDPDPWPAPVKELERQLDCVIVVDEIAVPIHGSPESKTNELLGRTSSHSE
jgi:hypothetical protein